MLGVGKNYKALYKDVMANIRNKSQRKAFS